MNSKEKTEKRRIQKLLWRSNNPEKVREQRRKWSKANREKVINYHKKYYKENRKSIIDKAITRITTKKETIPDFKEEHRKQVKKYNEETRQKFIEMYGGKCVCCGETIYEFLTLEHKQGQKGIKKEESRVAYRNAVLVYRPDIYEILCMNCNHSKGVRGYCPHQR